MHLDEFTAFLLERPIVGILRGLKPDHTKEAVKTLWESGVSLLEIPLHSPTSTLAFLESKKEKHSSKVFLGLGSVRNLDDYALARELGADFLVGPNLNREVLEKARREGLCYIPGVLSPSEIAMVLDAGQHYMKLFPASIFGPAGISQLLDPFPEAKVIAVGGVSLENAPQYLANGSAGVGIGKNLVSSLERQDPTVGNILKQLSTTF